MGCRLGEDFVLSASFLCRYKRPHGKVPVTAASSAERG